ATGCVAVVSTAAVWTGVFVVAAVSAVAPFEVPSVFTCAGEPVSDAVVALVAAMAAAAIASGALGLAGGGGAVVSPPATGMSAAIGSAVTTLSPVCAVMPVSVTSVVLPSSPAVFSVDLPSSDFDVADFVSSLFFGASVLLLASEVAAGVWSV